MFGCGLGSEKIPMLLVWSRVHYPETDHQILQYLRKAKFINDRVMRWALYLQGFRMRIEIKERDNNAADFLSRLLNDGD